MKTQTYPIYIYQGLLKSKKEMNKYDLKKKKLNKNDNVLSYITISFFENNNMS